MVDCKHEVTYVGTEESGNNAHTFQTLDPIGISSWLKLLAPELFLLILAHPVYKMWIIQEPNMLELWNKLHFEKKKNEEYIPCLKYSVPIFVE